jgi:16S rRNA (guanine1207-N2)-methyltransferase
MLEDLCGAVETLAVRGHGRVLAARRPQSTDKLRSTLPSWRLLSQLEIAGAAQAWVGYPGTFAAGRLDEGTRLLLSVLPRLPADARVLDYGCGSGEVSAAVLSLQAALAVDALDNDAVALEAVRENVPAARPVLADSLRGAGRKDYHAILSNPPLHRGIAEDHAMLEALMADAPAHLLPGGLLQMVVQRRLPLERQLAQHFAHAEVVAETGRYRVWRAHR